MTPADRRWHCCTVAPQPSIQNVCLEKGLIFTSKGADEPGALLWDFLHIVLHKISNPGYQDFHILIKPPNKCVSVHLNWILAAAIVTVSYFRFKMKHFKLWEVINNKINSQHRGRNHFSKNTTSNHLQELLSAFLLFWKRQTSFLLSFNILLSSTFCPELP